MFEHSMEGRRMLAVSVFTVASTRGKRTFRPLGEWGSGMIGAGAWAGMEVAAEGSRAIPGKGARHPERAQTDCPTKLEKA
ncbi:hypothetical protein HNR46_000408 [Haloferula luteola]|uniref:Uncharacterized protein n=1 Tax=Haloferula luteola TaxID=595692 RepID=A0A840V3F0_9BACT|nr:hypothetical protein [Haloferula luteola]